MGYRVAAPRVFWDRLLVVPGAELPRVLAKVVHLADHPEPDGKNKKRLKGQDNVFRIRSGHFRVLYTFRADVVWLLDVGHRRNIYDDDQLDSPVPGVTSLPGDPGIDLSAIKDDDDVAPGDPGLLDEVVAGNALEVTIDPALLDRLLVPAEYHALFCACVTEDDLIAADAPPAIVERVINAAIAPSLDELLKRIGGGLDAYEARAAQVTGELVPQLLKLDAGQREAVTWALGAGPALVRGGPGTGKSLITLYRVPATIAALRAAGIDEPKILVTTYTNALVASTRQLLQPLLGQDDDLVEVRTVDNIVEEVIERLGETHNPIVDAGKQRYLLLHGIDNAEYQGTPVERAAQRTAVDKLGKKYLLEEIEEVIDGGLLATPEDYLDAPRTGKMVELDQVTRAGIWAVARAFCDQMDAKGEATFAHYRRRAADAIEAGLIEPWYDAVLIDEAQDMPRSGLRVATGVARYPAYTFITADANQSIYGTTFNWESLREIVGGNEQVKLLGSCHRCTAEIERAAASYLAGSQLDEQGRAEPTVHRSGGSRPLVVDVDARDDEVKLLATYVRQATRRAQVGFGSCALLVPATKAGEQLARELTDIGIPATFVKGSALELESPGVKVLTLHSAKGLEFPVVAIAGFLDSGLPGAGIEGGPAEWNETFGKHRRTMYVGMTRAMRSLLVVRPRKSDLSIFQGFDDALWDVR